MTNQFMQEKWAWIEGTHTMRLEMLDLLTDADLSFNPGGQNLTLGGAWRELGEIEYAYLDSLKTFTTDFSYRNPESGLDTSVARLKAWLQALDEEMKTIISSFSDAEMKKAIARPGGSSLAVDMQLEVYLQALLIFAGKAVIYFRAMNKALPQAIQDYIA